MIASLVSDSKILKPAVESSAAGFYFQLKLQTEYNSILFKLLLFGFLPVARSRPEAGLGFLPKYHQSLGIELEQDKQQQCETPQ